MITDHRFHYATLIAALLACATAWPAELPAPQSVRDQLKTVAVMPVKMPTDVPNRAQVEVRIEQALEARLAAAGIVVIPASEMRALQDKVRCALGGYYDPRTGDVDEQRAKAINEEMKVAAAKALAALTKEDVPDSVLKAYGLDSLKFGPEYIVPKPVDPRVLSVSTLTR